MHNRNPEIQEFFSCEVDYYIYLPF